MYRELIYTPFFKPTPLIKESTVSESENYQRLAMVPHLAFTTPVRFTGTICIARVVPTTESR